MEQRHWRGPRSSCPGAAGPVLLQPARSHPRRCLPCPALRGDTARPREPAGSGPELRVLLFACSPPTRSGAGSTGVTEADTWRVNGGRTKGFVCLYCLVLRTLSRVLLFLNGFSRGLCDLHELPLGVPFPKGILLLNDVGVL